MDSPVNWLMRILEQPWSGGALLAVVMAVLRVLNDDNETRFSRLVLESGLCGSITVAAHYGLVGAGMPEGNWTIAAGGAIGLMGSQYVRAAAMMFAKNRASK